MADPRSHARHDRFAIAAMVGGGPAPATLGSCPACGMLYADLDVLRRALREAWAPRRTRDLRLTLTDVGRLRPRSWRHLLALLGSPTDTISRPIALSLTGLGLAGLLLTALPAVTSFGSAGAAPTAGERVTMAAGAASSPAPRDTIAAATAADGSAAGSDPVPILSTGLLSAGGAILAARRIARRLEGVR